jgi:inorganic pyrophosphatase
VEVRVLVEIPKGSRNKYELDHASGRLRLDRALHSAVHYPTDYGFIENTLSDDGDPLDALILIEEPTFPGCLVDARPVGAFLMSDEKGGDEKILCIPLGDPTWNHVDELTDVPDHRLREIENFFQIYKQLEGKPTVTFGWRDRGIAEGIVTKAFGQAQTPTR